MTDNQQILNPQTMIDLIGNDQALANKFKVDFLKQAQTSMKKIVSFYQEDDFTKIKDEAHFLKTSAKAVGAEQTSSLLQKLEEASLEENKETCKNLIMLINQSVKNVYKVVSNES